MGTNRLGLTVLSAAVFAAARVFGADTVSVPPTETPGELPAAASAIIGKALVGRHGEEDLRYLSDRIGGRLTGSPEAARAIAWAAERMRTLCTQAQQELRGLRTPTLDELARWIASRA